MRHHPNKRRRRRRLISPVLGMAAFILIIFWGVFHFASDRQPIEALDSNVTPLEINSANAILIKLNGEEILFEKNSTEKIFPASMTKMMTAIVALENISNLNESVVLRKELYRYITDATTAGFLPYEEVRVLDLLYGLLLPSGAECALGLAEHVSGSESAFAELMNDKAQALNMNGTHFTNATGLHDEEHYATVSDIAVLLQYALENETFYKIFTTPRYATQPTNLHEDGITYYSTLFSNMDTAYFKGGSILGGKTGFTDEAGQCLASLAEKDGEKFILVTGGAKGDHKTQKLHIDDAFTVYGAITSVAAGMN